jgi:hypothetical protein
MNTHDELRTYTKFQHWLATNYNDLPTTSGEMTERAIKYLKETKELKETKPTRTMKMNGYIINERRFYIWKLELWWVAFNNPQFYPDGRTKLKGNWFWRN